MLDTMEGSKRYLLRTQPYQSVEYTLILGNETPDGAVRKNLNPRISKNFVRISIPILLLTVSYCLCLLLGSIDLFYVLFWKISSALGSRALSFALCQMGCSGCLSFAIGLAVRAFFGSGTLFMDEAGPSSGTCSNPGNPGVPPVDPEVNQDDIWEAVEAEEARKEKELMLSKEWQQVDRHRLKIEDFKKSLGQRAKEIAQEQGSNPGRCEAVEDAAIFFAEDVEDLPDNKQLRFLKNFMRELDNPRSELWGRIKEEVKRWRSWEDSS